VSLFLPPQLSRDGGEGREVREIEITFASELGGREKGEKGGPACLKFQ